FRRAIGWVLSIAILAAGFSQPARQLGQIPDAIRLKRGGTANISFMTPIDSEVIQGSQVLSSMDEKLDDGGSNVSFEGRDVGNAQVALKLMGFTIKTVDVTVEPEKCVIPGGHSIGVALNMAGVLVVGSSDVGTSPSPARLSGLRSGDLISDVDGTPVTSAEALSRQVSKGGRMTLGVIRAGREISVDIVPVRENEYGAYRIGAWVRDSTAGVGTLSYYDPDTTAFAALGHAVTDVDTGTLLTLSEGEIYESNILGVLKGSNGSPGELLGEFIADARYMGTVLLNGAFGIYGKTQNAIENPLYHEPVAVMSRSEVSEGKAVLLTTLDDEGIKAYDCEIIRCYRQDEAGQRGMVIKITDERLLSLTGGIVQGMSGSPILQNGKLAGAVTHVFVDDPTQGYGMYAQWMLEQSDGI
ncbi:MAG: SpoIVB peptidase, partial [Clostridia bacterium]|nr:SpoIVB peptidase [Clostridia bacterium]